MKSATIPPMTTYDEEEQTTSVSEGNSKDLGYRDCQQTGRPDPPAVELVDCVAADIPSLLEFSLSGKAIFPKLLLFSDSFSSLCSSTAILLATLALFSSSAISIEAAEILTAVFVSTDYVIKKAKTHWLSESFPSTVHSDGSTGMV
ncbi:hypothetical protein RvY_13971 [Ramazzottius varieornatus]|uniref:Uncharacterized protein n=1 Tax=Ramazzottius varieornatus TaxID=947166 RepID=A0A1D1VX39_RAMVA|nr:hypothetical protein RvY_13971 [Ramazzottius varieornatus]